MGFSSILENPGEQSLYEVYGSSSRLAFSRYFVVAHVDGFLYVLDRYFCVFRLVPSRVKRSGQETVASCAVPDPASSAAPGSGGETHRAAGETDGRQPGELDDGYPFTAEDDKIGGGDPLIPIRIADVFSALFRYDKAVFSQLLTGNHQVSNVLNCPCRKYCW